MWAAKTTTRKREKQNYGDIRSSFLTWANPFVAELLSFLTETQFSHRQNAVCAAWIPQGESSPSDLQEDINRCGLVEQHEPSRKTNTNGILLTGIDSTFQRKLTGKKQRTTSWNQMDLLTPRSWGMGERKTTEEKSRHRRREVSGDLCFTSSPSAHQQKHDSNRRHKSLRLSSSGLAAYTNRVERRLTAWMFQQQQASERPKSWIFPLAHTHLMFKLCPNQRSHICKIPYSVCTS